MHHAHDGDLDDPLRVYALVVEAFLLLLKMGNKTDYGCFFRLSWVIIA